MSSQKRRSASTLTRELHYATRRLRTRWRTSLLLLCVMVAGIAASVVTFAILDGLLFRPLPYANPGQLVWIGQAGSPLVARVPISALDSIADRHAPLSSFGAYEATSATYHVRIEYTRAGLARVTGEFFRTLGVKPEIGRTITANDDRIGATRLVVISDSLWRSGFGRRPNAVGSFMAIDGQPFEIIGVMPASFRFPDGTAAWVSVDATLGPLLRSTDAPLLEVIGRLRSSASIGAVTAAIRTVKYPPDPASGMTGRLMVETLVDHVSLHLRTAVELLGLAAAFLLIVACFALSTVQLAELTEKRRDLAIRAALGATNRDLVRVSLAESAVLALSAGVIGLAVSYAAISLLSRVGTQRVPELGSIGLDTSIVLYAVAVTALTAAAGGLVPLFLAHRDEVASVLNGTGASASPGRTSTRTRDTLLGASVAVTLVLLVGAGVLAQSVLEIEHTNIGFDPAGVASAQVRLPFPVVVPPTAARIRTYVSVLLQNLQNSSGVRAAAVSTDVPGQGNKIISMAEPDRAAGAQQQLPVGLSQIGGAYFQALRIPILAGRAFLPSDNADAAPVVICDEDAAKLLFGGANPVGQTLHLHDPDLIATVVGVSGTVRQTGRMADRRPQIYAPFDQLPLASFVLLARGNGSYPPLAHAIAAAAGRADATAPVFAERPLDEVVYGELSRPAFYATTLLIFAAVAIAISAMGIYAASTALVSQRYREIAIRLALGATGRHIAEVVGVRLAAAVLIGVLLGWVMIFVGNRLFAAWFYGASSATVGACILGAGVVFLAAALAVLSPLHRAARVQPMTVLRT